MKGKPHRRTERLESYLDGLLTPIERIELEELIRGDAAWRAELGELRSLHALLDTSLDEAPPADLLPGILAAVEEDRQARSRLFRLSPRLENSLVLAGTASLAAGIAVAGRLVPGPAEWIGRATVWATSALSGATDAIVGTATPVSQLDWAARLVATLSGAVRTVAVSSAQPLAMLSVTTVLLTAVVAWVLLRKEKGMRGGEVTHVGLLA